MRSMHSSALLLAAVLQVGCTTIPSRFNTVDPIVDGCGYVLDGESTGGFALEIAYKEYKFFPSPDPVIVAARTCFSRIATELARRKGKTIIPLSAADMSAISNRNITDGNYLVNVAGRVRYLVP